VKNLLSFKGGAGSSKSEACDVYLPHLPHLIVALIIAKKILQ
jgi:hypothetical protein